MQPVWPSHATALAKRREVGVQQHVDPPLPVAAHVALGVGLDKLAGVQDAWLAEELLGDGRAERHATVLRAACESNDVWISGASSTGTVAAVKWEKFAAFRPNIHNCV